MPADSLKKLNDKTILVPRPAPPAGQTDKLAHLLELAGASVISHPAIELLPVSLESVRSTLARIDQFGSLVLVSETGVRFFFQLLTQIDNCNLESCDLQIAAIGHGTADAVERHGGMRVDFIADRADSQSLGQGLLESELPEPYLLIRADRGSATLSEILSKADKKFEQLAVYESRDIRVTNPETLKAMQEQQIDWITLTSPAIAKACIQLFENEINNVQLATISRSVTQVVEQLGFSVSAEAVRPGFDELVAAMLKHQFEN